MNFTDADKELFNHALHQVITSYHPTPSIACYSYAMLGAIALNHISGGRMDFVPQSGGRAVIVAPDPGDGLGPLSLVLDPKVMRNGRPEFHHWIIRVSTRELIDFSCRYIRRDADSQGLPWHRKAIPDFLWQNVYTTVDDHEIMYEPEPSLTDESQTTFQEFSGGQMPTDFKESLLQVLRLYVSAGGARQQIRQ